MKKLIVFGGLFVVLSLPLSAQGLYIDLGFGLGKGWTKLDGNDAMDIVDSPNGSSDFALDLGLKGGWGPFGSIPLYAVLEFEMMGHRVQNVDNYVQFNSYMIGPGVLFYPVPLIQLGLSLGYSWTGNNTDFSWDVYNSSAGFAWDVSAAFDLGGKNHACLLGVRYFNAIFVDENTAILSFFIKYAFRKKAPSLFK